MRLGYRTVGLSLATLGLIAGALPSAAGTAGAAAVPVRASAGGLSSSQANALSRDAHQSVIVVFKNQVSNLPASSTQITRRRAAVEEIQAPVLRELRQVRAANVHAYSLVDAVSATVSAAEEARLSANPAVAEVVPNQTAQLNFQPASAAGTAPAGGTPAPVSLCQPGPGGIELDPEALQAIDADSNLPGSGPTPASLGITGAGVTVAFIAEGIDVNQPNFIRADGKSVFTDQADFTGEGTPTNTSGGEASLDASSIAAQGNVIYDLKLADGSSCKIRIRGAAPGANLVSLKAFPSTLDATTTSLLEAIDYAVATDHVNVLNESFGYNPLPDTMVDVIRMADEAAVAAGTVVDVSSGDAGPTSTVGSPSTDPAVISAGASTTYRVYAQQDIENYDGIGANGWEDDNLSGLSSAGSTDGLKGPNLLAPGDLNYVTCNPSPNEFGVCVSGGTSEAAPLTSATAALVIQAFRKTHGGATPSPELVKQIITSTATDLGLPADQQGSGLLDSYRAVLAAESVRTPAASPKRTGLTIETSTSDITATAPVNSTVDRTFTVTNSGDATQRVSLQGRILSAPSVLASSSFTESGASWSKVVRFNVAPGTSYLAAHLATDPSTPGGVADVTLVDPLGRLAIDGLPQGFTDTSNVGVRYPDAGIWTAFLTFGQGSASATEPSDFTATAQNWVPFGTVTPSSVSLAPGASTSVKVALRTPATAGDKSAAIVLDAFAGQQTTIPVALRSLVPFSHGVGSFSASVLGGNGRDGAPASTSFFAFDVAKGEPELNVTTAYRNGMSNDYSVYLVSPQGETLGHSSNQLIVGGTATNPITETEDGAVSHVLNPAPGRWTLIVAFANPASGTKTTSPLTGTIDFSRFAVSTKGVPTSASPPIPIGTSATVAVTVTNSTKVPQSYFLDPRLSRTVTKKLTSLAPTTGITLPLSLSAAIPQWIVPTDTTGLLAQVDATAPVTFDMSPFLGSVGGEVNGDPQIGATSTGDSATARWADNPITPGDWNVDPDLTGVFRSQGAAPATANVTLVATTSGFNSDISTTYGDLWTGKGAVHPVTVSPGQTITLFAAITPSKSGTTSGTLYLDTTTDISPFGSSIPVGDQVAAIPYSYTTG